MVHFLEGGRSISLSLALHLNTVKKRILFNINIYIYIT